MKKNKLILPILLLLGLISFSNPKKSNNEEINGIWFSVDDKTGAKESEIKIWTQSGKLYGKIEKLIPHDPNILCDKCTGAFKNKPVTGMQIINGLEEKDNKWIGSSAILDPKTGNLHDVEIWLEDGFLKVRGYWGFLYRTQTWIRKK